MQPDPANPLTGRSPLVRFLWRWLITTIAVMAAAEFLPGIEHDGWLPLVAASLLLGVFNALLRPLLLLLSLPLVVFTLGLFTLVINALLLYFVSTLVRGFHVAGFWSAFWGALIISLVTIILNTVTGTGERRLTFRTIVRRPDRHEPPPGQGPVIDV